MDKKRAMPRGRPRTGRALSDAQRMQRMRERRRANGLKSVSRWVEAGDAVQPPYSSHRLLEARSLAMHVVIAEKILRNPGLLEGARRNLQRWRAHYAEEWPDGLRQWDLILTRPFSQIASIMTELSERGAQLRQSSPFAGFLSPRERRRIHEAFRP
jgi:hypothetical protein